MLLGVTIQCIFSISFLSRADYELVLLALWVIKSPSSINCKYCSSSKKCMCTICMINIQCAQHCTPVIETVFYMNQINTTFQDVKHYQILYSDPISSFMVEKMKEDTDGLCVKCICLHFILIFHWQVAFSACNPRP